MPAFVHTTLAPGAFAFRRKPVPTLDPSSFDTVTAAILFRGTANELLTRFPLGALASATGYLGPAGSVLYCMGPQGTPEEKMGHVWAEITWKGFIEPSGITGVVGGLTTGTHLRSASMDLTTTETTWPQGDVYLGADFAETPALRPVKVAGVTVDTKPWRVRLIDRVYSLTLTGITAAAAGTWPDPPKPILTDPGSGERINWAGLHPDPLLTYSFDKRKSDGWVCRNFKRTSVLAMGSQVLAAWEANYTWEERHGP